MAIKVKCPKCNTIISAQLKLAHKTMKCPKCGVKFEAVPLEEIQQTRQHAHDRMVKAKKRLEARKTAERQREMQPAPPVKVSLGPENIPQFESFEEFLSWWESPEIEKLRLDYPETIARLMTHRFIEPWIEQLLADARAAGIQTVEADAIPSEEDRQFAAFLVKYGLLPEEKIRDVMALQKRLAEQGQNMPLGKVVVLKGFVTPQDVQASLKLSHAEKPYSDTHYARTEKVPSSAAAQKPQAETIDLEHATGEVAPLLVEKAGREFGKYRLLGELGHGGFGVVYKAYDTELKRTVALKMLLGEESGVEHRQVEEFIREARAAAKLKHANIVQIHEFGEENGRHYFTMDCVEGISLEQVLAGRNWQMLSAKRVCEIMREVAEALEYAHGEGIIHRDIKPGNILLGEDEKPFLTDFGLAKELKGLDRSLTMTGFIKGTPWYMSPEQAMGDRSIDGRSDVFSLGAVMYEALTGRKPFVGTQLYDILTSVINKDPAPPHSVSRLIHKDLATICMKCLEKERPYRYQSARELSADISRFLDGEPILARPAGLATKVFKKVKKNKLATAGIAAAVVVVLAVAVWLAISSARTSAKIEVYIQEATEKFEVGEFADSRALCEKVLELSPGSRAAGDLRLRCVEEIAKLDKQSRDERDTAREEAASAQRYARRKEESAKIRAKAQGILDRMKSARLPEAKINACDDAIAVDPTFGLAWQEKGYAYKEIREWDKALECFSKAIELSPELVYAYHERAWINARVKDKTLEAISDLQKVIELDPGSHIAHFSRGYIEQRRWNEEEAILHYTRAIEAFPSYADAYMYRGEVYKRKGNVEQAISDFSKAIESDPKLFRAYRLRAALYEEQGNLDGAFADHTKLIEIYTGREYETARAIAYGARAGIQMKKGNLEAAIDDLTKAVKLSPISYTHYYKRAKAYRQKGELKKALRDFERYLELTTQHPDVPEVKRIVADLKKQLGHYAVDENKKNEAIAANAQGYLLYREGKYAEAIEKYTKAITAAPFFAVAYCNRGAAYFKAGEREKALADFNKAIQIEPDYAQGYMNRATFYLWTNDDKKAMTDYNKALELDPNLVEACYGRGLLRNGAGDYKGALEDLEKVLRLAPNHPHASTIKKSVETLKRRFEE